MIKVTNAVEKCIGIPLSMKYFRKYLLDNCK